MVASVSPGPHPVPGQPNGDDAATSDRTAARVECVTALKGPRKWAYQLYRSTPAPLRGVGQKVQQLKAEWAINAQPLPDGGTARLLVGPLNTAGQGAAWATAADQSPGVSAASLSVQGRGAAPVMGFSTDVYLDQPMQLHGLPAWRGSVLGLGKGSAMSHVLCESGRPILANFHRGSFVDDLPALRSVGIRPAVVFHGSDIRLPSDHARMYADSPFVDASDEYVVRLEQSVLRHRAALSDFDGPVFVSTPDLLDFLPDATWLPLAVDIAPFEQVAQSRPAALERSRPVVVHAPSNPRLKGTESIEATLTALAEDGLIDYRRLSGVPHAQMAAFIADADVVVDQVVLGNPGVLAVEAMAAGRVVVAHIAEPVRLRMADRDPESQGPPIVEATPATLRSVIEDVVAQRSAYADMASDGPAWARRNFTHEQAAAVLEPFLSLT